MSIQSHVDMANLGGNRGAKQHKMDKGPANVMGGESSKEPAGVTS